MDKPLQMYILQSLQGAEIEDVEKAVDRIHQHYVICNATVKVAEELLELKRKLQSPTITIDTLCEIATHMLRKPLSGEDRALLTALLQTISCFPLLYVTSQIVHQWNQQHIDYKSAVMEAGVVFDSFKNSPESALQRFLQGRFVATTLRNLHNYVSTHSPVGQEDEAYWLGVQRMAEKLRLAAEICDHLQGSE